MRRTDLGGGLLSALEESRLEALPVAVPVTEVAQPLRAAHARTLQLPSRLTRGVVWFGRASAVWLPVYGLVGAKGHGFFAGVGISLLVASAWLGALRGAFIGGRLALPARRLISCVIGSAGGLVLASALGLWLSGLGLHTWSLVEAAGCILVLATGWEYLVRETVSITRRVLIVGASDGGSELVEELGLHPDAPYVVVGVVDDERASESIAGVPLLGRVEDLPDVIARVRPDLVVLAVAQNRLEAFARLLAVATSGFKVLELPQFYEQAFGRVPVRRLTSAWFMSVLHLYQRPYTRFAKRTFDIIVATLGIALTAPLYPLVALLVKGTKGPLIFRQTRLGEGGKLFTIYKFRTMRNGAEEPGQPIWAEERDPRVTPLGRLLRRTRLDELPQLYNVVRGDMSIVGPRPERPEFVELLESTVPFWTRRHLVKPGVTGWAQVSCGYAADAEGTLEKLSYDLWYLRHRSLAVDLGICAKTIVALVSGSGAR